MQRVALDDFNTIPTPNVIPFPNGKRRKLVVTTASQVQRESVRWLDDGRVPMGLVTILAGTGGLGKSQWTCLIAGKLSIGEFGEPGHTLIATAEDSPETTVVPRLEAVQANLDYIHFLHIQTKEGDEDGIRIPDDLDQVEEMMRILGVRLLVIDPLVAHLPMQIDSHKDQSVRRALAPLYRLAKENEAAVIALMHLNKAEGVSRINRISGSTGFRNAARSVLFLENDPDDPLGEEGNRRVLIHNKCNVGPKQPPLLYEVRPIALEPIGLAPMVETSRLVELGTA